jgi:flavin-dependent dehydrogenase
VKRAELDALLFANAASKGADARQNTRVTDIRLGTGGARSSARNAGAALEWQPRYVLDASGRDTFMATRMR